MAKVVLTITDVRGDYYGEERRYFRVRGADVNRAEWERLLDMRLGKKDEPVHPGEVVALLPVDKVPDSLDRGKRYLLTCQLGFAGREWAAVKQKFDPAAGRMVHQQGAQQVTNEPFLAGVSLVEESAAAANASPPAQEDGGRRGRAQA